MKKNVLFIHSAGTQGLHQGSSDLAAYLQDALGDEYNVSHPEMPNPENPEYMLWKGQIKKELSTLDGEVILIGHSLGGSVLLKYLSEETCKLPILGLFLIAAPFWGKDEDWQAQEYTLQDDFVSRLPQISHIFIYQSRDDEIVPFSHLDHYAEILPQVITRELDDHGHYFNNGAFEVIGDIKGI
ncbi:alpha/beta hydrolase [Pseudalkalibacillus salsuginis]|uniref:alpha/beta hydrolase n=1 Tax=Pseudalkalibacillus salsuginis TaxID=2910972 RepID=UPI001F2C0AB6|nr:alpha/beta hydrolase [Pseudalkalibacillus salsuginis]MCF6409480.1 alpha/beta hydrolase [Pseudalkalibacillus salsuginis]